MTQNLDTLDKWRSFFQTANSDIFVIINNAICVAAKDCPEEFQEKRDKILEDLFSGRFMKCIGCDHVKSSDGTVVGCKSGLERENGVFGKEVSKGISKMISNGVGQKIVNVKQVYDYNIEALYNELEEERQVIDDVMRIKKIFESEYEESESVLLDSLRWLYLMDLSVDKLNITKIGRNVNRLKKHRSQNIRLLSKTIVTSWKSMINDKWSLTAQTIAAADTPESVKSPGLEEEEGLPFPPLEEGILFLSHPTYFELSNFFDDIDDNGNPRESEELSKNLEAVPSKKNNSKVKTNKPNPKPPNIADGSGRQVKVSVEKKTSNGTKFEPKTDKGSIQNRSTGYNQEKSKSMDLDIKLKDTKRKLHGDYQQVEKNPRESEKLSKNLEAVPSKNNNSKAKMNKPNPKPPNIADGSGRQVKVSVVKKTSNGTKFEPKTDKGSIQNRSTGYNQEKSKSMDLDIKLEATKRKLHEDYQQVEKNPRKSQKLTKNLEAVPSKKDKKKVKMNKPNPKPPNIAGGSGRQVKVSVDKKTSNGTKFELKTDKVSIQNRSTGYNQEKSKSMDLDIKLEATKRKLHEDYQQVEKNPLKSQKLTKNLEVVPSKKDKKKVRMNKPNPKPPNIAGGSGRQVKVSVDKKTSNGTKFELKTDKGSIQNRSNGYNQEKSKSMDLDIKLEATKRKLHEDYQQVEKNKKQRTIQMIELCDIPKQGLGHRNPYIKLASQNRLVRRR